MTRGARSSLAAALLLTVSASHALAESLEQRVERLNDALTTEERLILVRSLMAVPRADRPTPAGAIAAAGYVPGIPRLGIPGQYQTDGPLGVTNPRNARPGDGATALPSALALAATFDNARAREAGAMIGAEARSKGFNMLLAGSVNLAREPRSGRNFENLGEDPWLAGTLAGELIQAIQSKAVSATVKHFVLNDQESARHDLDARIDEGALRESDLLAFQLAIERGQPAAVMCAYNRVNGPYACASDFLLKQVLRDDWKFKGWVISDWGAVASADYAAHGLDQQAGSRVDPQAWFAEPLKNALANGTLAQPRLREMTGRILYGLAASGVLDRQAGSPGDEIDAQAHEVVARRIARESIVLLRNQAETLPLSPRLRRILVIGGRADIGVLSGGGSSQVTAPDTEAYRSITLGTQDNMANWGTMHFQGKAPLAAIRERAPEAKVGFYDGRYPGAAASLAKEADTVILFANQWMTEGEDAPDLSLPDGQDALIDAVTRANPNTVVVLQSGGAVQMPWLQQSKAVLAAWYSGAAGADAIADVLFGSVSPSGRLPLTFPASLKQLPREQLPGWGTTRGTAVEVPYHEGADIGYRWLARNGARPLFAFGHGLSYTHFSHSGLSVDTRDGVRVRFTVRNVGTRGGMDVPQLYLSKLNGKPVRRLLGFAKPDLAPGQSQEIELEVDRRLLSHFDAVTQRWVLEPGHYRFTLANSAIDSGLSLEAHLNGWTRNP